MDITFPEGYCWCVARGGNDQSGEPTTNVQMLLGALAAFGGYLLPWLDASGSAWTFSGWGYAHAADGKWLLVACLLWAAAHGLPDDKLQARLRFQVLALATIGVFVALLGFANASWTRLPIACLLVAIGGSLRTGRSQAAAKVAVAAGSAGMFCAFSVVAASIGSVGVHSLADVQPRAGLLLMAGGFGVLLASVIQVHRPTVDRAAP